MATNMNSRHRKLGYKGDARVPFARLGWEDARLGMPFRYDIAGASRVQMAAYENCRMRVLVLREKGVAVPAWNVQTSVPPKVRSAINAIQEDHSEIVRSGGCSWFAHGDRYWQPAA